MLQLAVTAAANISAFVRSLLPRHPTMLSMNRTHPVASVRSPAVILLIDAATFSVWRFSALLFTAILACAAAAVAQPAPTPATTEQLELIARATENELQALEN